MPFAESQSLSTRVTPELLHPASMDAADAGRGVQAIHAVDPKLKAGLVTCLWPAHAMLGDGKAAVTGESRGTSALRASCGRYGRQFHAG